MYARMLGFAKELPEGWSRDELGQVRSPTGEKVCGISGRVGSEFLIPRAFPDPVSGEYIVIFVHKRTLDDEASVLGRRARSFGSSLGFLFRTLAREGLSLLRSLIGR